MLSWGSFCAAEKGPFHHRNLAGLSWGVGGGQSICSVLHKFRELKGPFVGRGWEW